MTPSDGDVVDRVRSGDTEAFGVLVERYYGRCIRYALHMVGDKTLAEDLVQDSFLRAFRALPSYDHRNRFDRWLLSIVANRARTEAAKRSRKALRTVTLDAAAQGVADGRPPADPFIRSRVREALDDLSPTLREALLLRCVEEMSYAEMSDATGAGESALKMRVARAKDALRRGLGRLEP